MWTGEQLPVLFKFFLFTQRNIPEGFELHQQCLRNFRFYLAFSVLPLLLETTEKVKLCFVCILIFQFLESR